MFPGYRISRLGTGEEGDSTGLANAHIISQSLVNIILRIALRTNNRRPLARCKELYKYKGKTTQRNEEPGAAFGRNQL